MADRAASRRSGDGIHRAILEAGLGRVRTVVETNLREAGRSRPDVGKLTSGASLVQSWSTRAQARLPRCRAFSEAAGIAGASLELRAGYRATPVADTHAHTVSTNAGKGASAESAGGTAGRSPY